MEFIFQTTTDGATRLIIEGDLTISAVPLGCDHINALLDAVQSDRLGPDADLDVQALVSSGTRAEEQLARGNTGSRRLELH